MIRRIFKGTYVLCQCDTHHRRWKEGEEGCAECLDGESLTNVMHNVGFNKDFNLVPTPTDGGTLREGVIVTKNNRYMLRGKFIGAKDAFK